jgi:transposase
LFGEIVDGEMILNPAGRMVEKCWLAIPNRYRNVILHECVVMPNHFHAILQIDTVGATLVVAPDETVAPDDIGRPQGSPLRRKTVGQKVGAFKSITTNEYIRGVEKCDWLPFDRKLWQRNYYEHIIRNAESYGNIAEYIITNPARWQDDNLYIRINT